MCKYAIVQMCKLFKLIFTDVYNVDRMSSVIVENDFLEMIYKDEDGAFANIRSSFGK